MLEAAVPEDPPRTLHQVNKQLGGRWARIRQANGDLIEYVEDVTVGPDTMTFHHRMDQEERFLPTRRVRAVQVRKRSRSRRDFIAGAVPGLFLVALRVRERIDCSSDSWNALSVLMIGGGLMIAAIGELF